MNAAFPKFLISLTLGGILGYAIARILHPTSPVPVPGLAQKAPEAAVNSEIHSSFLSEGPTSARPVTVSPPSPIELTPEDKRQRKSQLERTLKVKEWLKDIPSFYSSLAEMSGEERHKALRLAGSLLATEKDRDKLILLAGNAKNATDTRALIDAFCISYVHGNMKQHPERFLVEDPRLFELAGPGRNSLVGSIASAMSIGGGDVVAAANLVTATNSYLLPDTGRNLGARWGSTDPQACLQWIGRIPDSGFKDQAVIGLMSGWVRTDSVAASNCLAQIPDSYTKDLALSGMAVAYRTYSLNQATVWAEQIQDEKLKEETMRKFPPVRSC